MTPLESALEKARKIAEEWHCRYCDFTEDHRVKCKKDLEEAAKDIARARLTAEKEALEWAMKPNNYMNPERIDKRIEEIEKCLRG